MSAPQIRLDTARAIAGAVPDPELPMLTLRDLGVLRDVHLDGERVIVELTPTYSGCPAMAVMRGDVATRLRDAGFDDVEVRTVLAPAWSSDDITDEGRRALTRHGIAPPGPAAQSRTCPMPVLLGRAPEPVACPRCGSFDTDLLSQFGSTPCKALHRCRVCAEPFEHFKAHG